MCCPWLPVCDPPYVLVLMASTYARTEFPAYLNWYTYEAYDKMLFVWSHGMINTFREKMGLARLAVYVF